MPITTATRSRRSRLALLAGAVLALALILSACGGGGSSKASNADIVVHDFGFATKTVAPGATVTVHDNGPSTHTVSADNGSFDLTIDSGKDKTFTAPTKAGTYKFHCNIHPQMHGVLTVQ
jgi:plastocyanin